MGNNCNFVDSLGFGISHFVHAGRTDSCSAGGCNYLARGTSVARPQNCVISHLKKF